MWTLDENEGEGESEGEGEGEGEVDSEVEGEGKSGGKDEGAGAWTCALARVWNSQHWTREGAWRIEGISHGPSAQRRARKFAERIVIAVVDWFMNDSLQLHACSFARRDALPRATRLNPDKDNDDDDGGDGDRFSFATNPPMVSVTW